jgi:hypothetical protein
VSFTKFPPFLSKFEPLNGGNDARGELEGGHNINGDWRYDGINQLKPFIIGKER